MNQNLSEDRIHILKMVEEGKITPDEGVELLNALEKNREETGEINTTFSAKWLRVKVKGEDGKTKVNVNLPISLIELGLKLGIKFSPDLKNAELENLNFNEIIEAIKNGAEGKIVEVNDEETKTHVEVYVE